MSHLRFLVIDEADRMISQGNFPQLKQIFAFIQKNSPQSPPEETDSENEESESDSEDEDRLKHLQGVRGETKVKMLDDDILKQIEQQKLGEAPVPINELEDEDENDDDNNEHLNLMSDEYENVLSLSVPTTTTKYVPRQTFIYSATLTLPSTSTSGKAQSYNNKKKKNRGHKNKSKHTVEGAIAEIMEQAGATGQTKVVDLTTEIEENNASKETLTKGKNDTYIPSSGTNANNSSKRLPPGLSLYQIQCTQKHKDSHCYAYLATTEQGSSGPCLIFCNSIPGVRRVGATLQTLGLPVRMLHAQMAQKARFSALDSLKKSGSRSIVVATDVAARGLDIPSVATVIHYDVARTVDIFVHRAGRTAVSLQKIIICLLMMIPMN